MIERLNKYEQQIDMNAKEKKKISQSLEEYDTLKNKLQELQLQFERKKKENADLEIRNKALLNQIDKLKGSAGSIEEERQKYFIQLKDLRNDYIITQVFPF